ncbi:hypothetical protein C0Q70_17658 [Pomacea canaliculata]|uniref:LRRCT domain-containing protein n=1 Tax=Pomacea canaliculata TaxID=400727 RepID=A0A2T7NL21_POMCA|nr:hypothetical protein C0Q70_17658 [Pomacea canaliculata]
MLLSCFTTSTSFSLTLAVLTLLFLCPLTRSHALWTYNVTWPDGNVTSFAFPRASHGDCLYDKETDVLTCTRNHGYQSVINTWTYDPELILYVSVRCLAPIPRLQLSSPTCLCKQRKNSPPLPSKVKGGSQKGNESSSKEGFDFCQLQQLSDGLLEDLEELQVLDLSHNLLQRLRSEAFRHLPELRVLSLKDNPHLHALPEALTCELKSLEVLDVSHLPLQIFPAGAFHCGVNSSHVPSLRWLDASNSRINAMPDHSLWNLGSLQFLNLSDNFLQHLPPHPLLGAISLTALDISRNFLSSLPSDFCEVDSKLRTLLMRENRFESLRLESLEDCGSLVELDVSKNVISVLYGPPARLPLLLRLRLSHNRLQTLTTPLVTDNNSLNKLDLSGNQLKNIGNAVMDNLSTLETLSLDGNALNELSVNLSCVFKQLANLKVLNLSNNLFQAISEADFSGLTSLQILDLSGNHISQVAFGLGSSLWQLRVLNLSGNLLTSVFPAAFAPLENLRELYISSNLLHHVHHFQLPASLLTFDLSHNFLHVAPVVDQGVPKLKDLHLAWNAISSLEDNALGDLRSLESLDLSHNNLTSISPSSFQNLLRLRALSLTHNKLALNDSSVGQVFSVLRQLQQLNLSNNHMTDIRPLFQLSTLLALLELDLSFNPIGQIAYRLNPLNITRHLQHLLLRGCGLQEVSAEAFSGLIYLRTVSLQENLLSHFPLFHAHPGVTFHLHGNPVACSCHMSWLTLTTVEKWGQTISTSDYDVRACRVAPRNFLRPVRDLQSRDFLCVAKSCPGNCTCYSQNETGNTPDVVFCQASSSTLKDLPSSARVVSFEGSILQKVDAIGGRNQSEMNIQELYLNGSGVSELSNNVFVSLSRLLTLDLGNNRLTELPPSLLAPLHNLTSLSLSHNQLTSLPDGLLSESLQLRVIDLSHNLLTTLTTGVTRSLRGMADLRVVRLGNNSWRCECDNAELYHWLKENAWLVPDRPDVLCAEDSGSDVAGRPVLSLNDNVFLCGERQRR